MDPLLISHQNQYDPFSAWLKKLGLEEFLRSYPLQRLIEWGWVVPQYRVIFPKEFFTTWDNFPCLGHDVPPELRAYALLWDSNWFIDNTDEAHWFLHPFFAPNDELGEILTKQSIYSPSKPVPEEFTHHNGDKICPYADYYFHWQGYALIDVIRNADCIQPLLNTPDIEEQAANMIRLAKVLKQHDPKTVLTIEKRWGGLAKPMTWLSHYRALRSAIDWYERLNNRRKRMIRRKGAKQLADYFEITEEILSSVIKDQFLVLAQNWRWANERYSIWTMCAWPHLQRDIEIAVEWLCYLSGKPLDYFLDEWRYKHIGQETWAELHEVLPYEFFSDREEFLVYAPYYLKTYNQLMPESERLEKNNLAEIIDRLRSTNYQFISFLGSFRQLHDELSYRHDQKGNIDFRELRPLDHYSLLAIRAEGAFRYALDKNGLLKTIKPQNQKLKVYILCLAKKRGISTKAVNYFKKISTRLDHMPPDPIGEIMSLVPDISPQEDYLIKAFLCCNLARNYFAHHYYLDHELPRSEKSGFMLSGILVTVLYLL